MKHCFKYVLFLSFCSSLLIAKAESYSLGTNSFFTAFRGLNKAYTGYAWFPIARTSGSIENKGAAMSVFDCENNQAPVANPNLRTTTEDLSLLQASSVPGNANNLLTNDIDPEAGVLTVTGYSVNGQAGTPVIGSPFNISGTFPDGSVGTIGTITINANGSYGFTLGLNYNGTVPTITYVVTDACAATSSSTLTIVVSAVDDCPQLHTPSRNVIEDSPLPFTGMSISDPDGSGGAGYTFVLQLLNPNNLPLAQHGFFTATSANGVIVTFSGTDSLVMSGSFIDINAYLANSATVPVYTPPVDYNTGCGTLGQLRSRLYQTGLGFGTIGNCDEQIRSLNIIAGTDLLVYNVNACQEVSKSFNVLTGAGTVSGLPNNFEVNTSTPAQTVTITAINSSPIVNPIILVNGQLNVNANGDVTFTPNGSFVGAQTFTYTAQPGTGCAETRQVTVTVQAPPNAAAVAVTQPSCTVNTGTVTISSPTGSGLAYSIDGTNYQSALVFNNVAPGMHSVTVRSNSGCVSASTAVTITAADCLPVAVNDTNTTIVNTPINGNMASNDACGPDTPCTYSTTPVSNPTNGVVSISANGTYTYTPNTGFVGIDTFEYELCDANGDCVTAQVEISVNSPMPVELVYFKVQNEGESTLVLRWKTGPEISFSHFGIEHSSNAKDFNLIGKVSANGSGSEYRYETLDINGGVSYFRLKMVDKDHSYTLSNIISAQLDDHSERIKIYPTISEDKIIIEGLSGSEIVRLFDMRGRLMYESSLSGSNKNISIRHYPPGLYNVIIFNQSGTIVKTKVIKM